MLKKGMEEEKKGGRREKDKEMGEEAGRQDRQTSNGYIQKQPRVE